MHSLFRVDSRLAILYGLLHQLLHQIRRVDNSHGHGRATLAIEIVAYGRRSNGASFVNFQLLLIQLRLLLLIGRIIAVARAKIKVRARHRGRCLAITRRDMRRVVLGQVALIGVYVINTANKMGEHAFAVRRGVVIWSDVAVVIDCVWRRRISRVVV